MKFRNISYLLMALLGSAIAASAQESPEHTGQWSLEECIQYAIDHNITVKQQDLHRQSQEIELNTARNSRLPDLNGSVSENFSFGRGLTSENTYSNNNTTSTGFSLGSSVPVFQGLRIRNTIKESELNLQAATEDLERAKDDIRVQVAQAYVQILYNMELLDVALNQVSIDSMQVERLSEMLNNGKASAAELAQQKATLGQSRLSATQARNDLNISLLDLSQLLELHNPEGFTIVRPEAEIDDIMLTDPDEIYADAITAKPVVRAEEFRLKAYEWTIKNAKTGYMPTLSLSGGIGTNYYTLSGVDNDSFADQMKHNFSQYIGLSLSVPLFNKFQTRNQVRTAQLSKINQELQLESVKKSLYKEIQQAYYNAVAAQEQYRSSTDAEASAKESYDQMLAKYENGLANITEFNEARDNYLSAESTLVRSRYQYLYSARLLDFYRGHELTL
jgi:outer membrane protein